MSLTPILSADPIIQTHVTAALIALTLGPVALWRKRRDRLHKVSGYVWVLAMAVLALSSFGISSGMEVIGPFSPLHGLAVAVLVQLWLAIRAVHRKDIATHLGIMRGLYYGGILIAGAFNFLPGRTINRIIFPQNPELGWWAIGLILCLALTLWLRPDRRIAGLEA